MELVVKVNKWCKNQSN